MSFWVAQGRPPKVYFNQCHVISQLRISICQGQVGKMSSPTIQRSVSKTHIFRSTRENAWNPLLQWWSWAPSHPLPDAKNKVNKGHPKQPVSSHLFIDVVTIIYHNYFSQPPGCFRRFQGSFGCQGQTPELWLSAWALEPLESAV